MPIPMLPVTFRELPAETEAEAPTLNDLSQSLWGLLGEALGYPVARGNFSSLVLAAIVMFLIAVTVIVPFAGLVTFIGGVAYLAAYYFEIIHHTISGKSDVPVWPDMSSYWDDIVIPGVQMAGICIFSYLPLFLCGWLIPEDELVIGWLSRGACYAFVSIFFPMATLAVVCTGSLVSALPHHVLPAILHCLPGYWLCAVLFGVAEFGRGGLASLFLGVPILGFLLPWLLAVYAMFVQARLTGLIYLRYSDRLPW
jgi:hypothetical protein